MAAGTVPSHLRDSEPAFATAAMLSQTIDAVYGYVGPELYVQTAMNI